MPWFKVDDQLHAHPKIARLLEAGEQRAANALALWTVAGSWAAQAMSDGFVSEAMARRLSLVSRWKQAANDLERAGLWDPGAHPETGVKGWYFHDWLDLQPSAADLRNARQKARDRKRRQRAASRPLSHRDTPACPAVTSRARAIPDPDPDPIEQTPPPLAGRSGGGSKASDEVEASPPTKPSQPSPPKPAEQVKRVWDRYLEGWGQRIGRGRPPHLDDKRRKHIRRRIESHGVDAVIRAVDGLWAATWWTKPPQPEWVFASTAKLENRLADADQHLGPPPPPPEELAKLRAAKAAAEARIVEERKQLELTAARTAPPPRPPERTPEELDAERARAADHARALLDEPPPELEAILANRAASE